MSASDAAASVGRIEEVVAAIVVHLPTTAIARARRVSKTWQYEIERSSICQQKLFVQPRPATQYIVYRHLRQCSLTFETWLKEHTTAEGRWNDERFKGSLDFKKVIITPHPLLGDGRPKNMSKEHMRAKAAASQLSLDAHELLSLPSGPWQDMYLTQPPADKATMQFAYTFDDGPFRKTHFDVKLSLPIKSNSKGLRFSDLPAIIRQGLQTEEPDFWSWLPDAYDAEEKIELDSYLASYGFPKFKVAWLELPTMMSESDALVEQARRSHGTPIIYSHDARIVVIGPGIRTSPGKT